MQLQSWAVAESSASVPIICIQRAAWRAAGPSAGSTANSINYLDLWQKPGKAFFGSLFKMQREAEPRASEKTELL